MNEFTNNPIEINFLPKFEEVKLNSLNSKYVYVLLINLVLILILVIAGFLALFFLKQNSFTYSIWAAVFIGILLFFIGLIVFVKLSFHRKGYAFRTHDVIYKSGLISQTTTIIPFNRVQHVALYQGFISRNLGLASIELFTAGGSSSDLKIPGILLEDAQKIKNLVSQKINPPKKDEPIEIQPNEPTVTEEHE